MARIKILDLPKDAKISKEELKRIKGGYATETERTSLTSFDVLKINEVKTSVGAVPFIPG